MSETPTESNEWYFDLNRGVAVPGEQRGHADHMLGPYPSKSAAENWKNTVETRNDTWDADDERWEQAGERPER